MSCETKHPISHRSVDPLLNETLTLSPTCDPDLETCLCTVSILLCQALHHKRPSLLGEYLSCQAIIIAAASAAFITMSSIHPARTSPLPYHIKKTGVKAARSAPVSKPALKGSKVKPVKSEEEIVDSFEDDDDMGCSFLQFWYAVTRLHYSEEDLTYPWQCNV